MKRVYLTFLLTTVAAFSSFGQTTLTENSSGVLNTNIVVAQTVYGQIFFTGHQVGSTYAYPGGIFRAWTDNPNGSLNYFYDGITNGVTNFSIRSDGQGYFAGNVGIGTTAPTALLHINGPLNGTSSLTFGVPGTTGNLSVPVGSTTGGYNIDFNTYRDIVPNQIGARIRAERINYYQPNNALVQSMDMVFYTSVGYDQTYLTEKLRIVSNGNVGIGTSAPGGKLELYNNSHSATNLVLSADYNNNFRWRFNTVDRGNAVDMDMTASNSIDAQETVLTLSPTFSGRPQLALEGNWLVANNGNIGIGTTDNSNWQLATSIYKLAVNGSAIATSMTVKAYNNWPDYVFKPTYTLPSLSAVKTYIDQNHHLPEIPTAEQIEKDGLNLGEMNKLLVKKVEELTLYLIEKDKEIKQQQAEISVLKQQMELLIKSSNKH